MSAVLGASERDDHDVADADRDLIVASRTEVDLRRLKGLNGLHRGRESAHWIV